MSSCYFQTLASAFWIFHSIIYHNSYFFRICLLHSLDAYVFGVSIQVLEKYGPRAEPPVEPQRHLPEGHHNSLLGTVGPFVPLASGLPHLPLYQPVHISLSSQGFLEMSWPAWMKTEFLDLLLLLHSLLVDGTTRPRAGTLGPVLILPLPRLLQKGTAGSRVVLPSGTLAVASRHLCASLFSSCPSSSSSLEFFPNCGSYSLTLLNKTTQILQCKGNIKKT